MCDSCSDGADSSQSAPGPRGSLSAGDAVAVNPNVAVIGNGYVGTVVAACFAWLGRFVVGVESNLAKLRMLQDGRVPFYEPELDTLVTEGLRNGRLRFTGSAEDALAGASLVFICVGAPAFSDGTTDLRAMDAAASAVGRALADQVVVIKSTVPIGSNQWLTSVLADARPPHAESPVRVVSNPEFLREGAAVSDFLHPDRVVLGSAYPDAIRLVAQTYRPILDQTFPGGDRQRRPALVRTTPSTAEAIKYASNAFLAMKISFINEIANICGPVGADVAEVAAAMGLDARIGAPYLTAGVGWGGSCLGKDLAVLRNTARSAGYEPHLLDEVTGVNQRQRRLVTEKLRRHLGRLAGRRVCLLGLAFKPGTDDLRDAPAVDIARSLLSEGASLSACDPVVAAVPGLPDLEVVRDPYEAAEGADAVVLLTEWPEFFDLDLHELRRRMQGDLYLDGRNVLKIGPVREAGFVYESFGRVQPSIGALEVIDLTLMDVPTTGDGDGNGFSSGQALEIDGPCTILD